MGFTNSCRTKIGWWLKVVRNFSRTINRHVKMDHYPIPRIDDILAGLSGCEIFCVLDLTNAYLQLGVSKKSRE